MTSAQVHEATQKDQLGIYEVNAKTTSILRRTYRPTLAALQSKERLMPQQTRLVALLKDRVVGTVEYRFVDDRLHFLGLGVHPEHQCREVARHLIKALEAIGQEAGARCLSAYTVRQTGNVKIFEQLGFTAVSEEQDHTLVSDIHPTLTDVYLEKPIPLDDSRPM